jgi:hypothetical protein
MEKQQYATLGTLSVDVSDNKSGMRHPIVFFVALYPVQS